MHWFTRAPHEKELWGPLWWGKGQVRRHLLLPRLLQSTRRLADKPAPSRLVPTKPHRRVWKAASLVLSTLLSLIHEADTCTEMDSYTSDLALSSNWMSLLKYPKLSWCLFGMETVCFPSRKKALFGRLASRINPLDYCNQVFLTLNAMKNPIQEQQKSLRKCLVAKVK